MNSNKMVSVLMITYNHEKFVEKAIESIISQKTNFEYELIIHDDASSDDTQKILKCYQEKYPEIIRLILQTENQYSQGKLITDEYLIPICKGKYIAFCEGDDYWIDDHKLQKQFDFLENRLEINACACRHYTIDAQGNILSVSHEGEELNRIFNAEDAKRLGVKMMHPNTIMARADIRKSKDYYDKLRKSNTLGSHSFQVYYYAMVGGVYIFEDIMTVWRKNIEQNGSSYASRTKQHEISYGLQHVSKYCIYNEIFNDTYDFKDEIVSNATEVLIAILKNKESVSKQKALKELSRMLSFKQKLLAVQACIKRVIKRGFKWKNQKV